MSLNSIDKKQIRKFGLIALVFFGCLCALGIWREKSVLTYLFGVLATLGLGFIIALNRPPLDLRASPILVPIAHTLVAFPFVVRSLTPALRSIQPRLRYAAAMLGASPGYVF